MANSKDLNSKYTPTIGIECHVQLKTKTKLFSGVGNDAREAPPNSLISHIDIALPGALPVLNEAAIELAARAAFALNTKPQKNSYFERKHYFYPDSPAGYQITQLHSPIIVGGSVAITVDGQEKKIRVNRAQLEADAGKTIHPAGADYSLVDLNRVGTPLLEIISEPDLHSAAEAKAYARELYLIMKYSDVSEADLYHGNMRFDVNTSVSADSTLGTRTEVKNLNSFKSVEAAVEFEIERQIELLEKGQKITQETRGWDEAKQKTVGQRTKEEAHDYRYMPEPDIPPIELSEEFLGKIREGLDLLPRAIREKLNMLSIDGKVVEEIIDKPLSVRLILNSLDDFGEKEAKRLLFWLLGENEGIKVNYQEAAALSAMVDEGQLSSTSAKVVFSEMAKKGGTAKQNAERLSLLQVSDESAIEKIVQKVISANPKAAEDVKKGELKAIGFLVGQVMAASQGQANPELAQKIIKLHLGL